MIKGRRLHGSVVIQNHKRIGRVEDIVLDPHTGQFQGLLIMPESGMGRRRFLPAEDIGKLAEQVYVKDKARLLRLPAKTHYWQNFSARLQNGLKAGGEQGTICDYYLEQNRLIGVEVSRGVIADVQHGRTFVPWSAFQGQNDAFLQ